jgi:cell division protein FtsN
MSQPLSSDADKEDVPMGNEDKSRRKLLLLILLMFVLVLVYLYLFTGLFGTGTESSGKAVQNVVLKKPMPQRPNRSDEAKAKETGTVARQNAKLSEGLSKTSQPLHPKLSLDMKETKPDNTTAEIASEKPPQGKQHHPQKGSSQPVSAVETLKKADLTQVAKKEDEHSIVKPVKTEIAAAKPGKGNFTLLIGVYVVEKSMTAEKAKLKSAGLSPVIRKGPKKIEPMNRLFISEFDSRSEATEELQKLKKWTHDAFILPDKGRYTVYAGSYFLKARAESEQNRLIKQGFNPVVQKADVRVSTMKLTAGSFSTKKAAEEKAAHLRKLGIKATVLRTGV